MPTFHPGDDSAPTLTVGQAQKHVLDAVTASSEEAVTLTEAAGRVLREPIVAPCDVPLADNSAMDGYAIVAEDLVNASESEPAVLRVIEDIAAGRLPRIRIERGTAARIMTGANVPVGADAIAQVEITDAGHDSVRIFHPVPAGAHIRQRGDDVRAGTTVLGPGTLLGAGEIALLATFRKRSVRVGRRPRVAILATGDELRDLDSEPSAGTIANSNSYALAILASEAGALPELRGIVRDTREATSSAIAACLDCDFIVSSGGVSAGAFDFVKEALDDLGAETGFWRVAMKPGKPILFARLRERLYFGLPGNPVSSMVGFLLFVAPAIRKASGQSSNLLPPALDAVAAAPLRGSGDRTTFVRVRLVAKDGRLTATPMRRQGSHMPTSMVEANGLAVVEAGVKAIEAGEPVRVMLIGMPIQE